MDLIAWFDGKAAEIAEAKAQYLADIDAAKGEGQTAGEAIGYKKGYEEGKAAIELPDAGQPDAVYTQQQMNDAVNTGKDEVRELELKPLQGELETAKTDKAALETKVAGFDVEKADAVKTAEKSLKAKIKEQYAAQQVAETEGETGFNKLFEVEEEPALEPEAPSEEQV